MRVQGVVGKRAADGELDVRSADGAARGLILALDLGTMTGWACEENGVITSGVMSFRPGRFEGGGMRYLRFGRWLDEMGRDRRIGGVYFEEVRRHAATDAAHVYGGLMATLTFWCEARRIPYAGIPVATIKKSATGKGNADKAAMIAAMQKLGHRPVDDNEADALALLRYVLADKTCAAQGSPPAPIPARMADAQGAECDRPQSKEGGR